MILSVLEATFLKKLKQAKLTFSSMYLFNPVYPIVFQQVINTKNWSFWFFCGLFVGATLSVWCMSYTDQHISVWTSYISGAQYG